MPTSPYNGPSGSTSNLAVSADGAAWAPSAWATDCANGASVLLWSPSNGRFFKVKARCQRLTKCSGCRAIMAERQFDVIARACQDTCERCGQPAAAQLYVGRPTRQEWKPARERRDRIHQAGGVARPRGRPAKNGVNSALWGSAADCPHAVESIKVAHRDDERLFVLATHDLAPAARRGGLQAVGIFTPHRTADALELLRGDLARPDYARRDCTEGWRVRSRNWRITIAADGALTDAMQAVGVREGESYSKEQIAALAQRLKEHLAQGGEAP